MLADVSEAVPSGITLPGYGSGGMRMSDEVIERDGCRIEPQSQWVPSGRGLRKGWRPKATVSEAGDPRLSYVLAPQDVETFPTKEEADEFMRRWAQGWLDRRRLSGALR
jgi:hypothetical protein